MTKKVTSIRGEEVDFDLLKIKSGLEKKEKPLDVKTREDFVHLKRKRRGNSKIEELVAARRKEEEEAKLKEAKDAATEKAKKDAVPSEATNEAKKPNKRKIVKKDDQ